MWKKNGFIGFFFLVCISLQAQFNPVLRVEWEIYENDMPFTVLPLAERGVAVVMDQNDLAKSSRSRSIDILDTNLRPLRHLDIAIENTFSYIGYMMQKDNLHFFLSDLASGAKQAQIALLSMRVEDSSEYVLQKFPLNLDTKSSILYIQMYEGAFLFLTKEKNTYQMYRYSIEDSVLQRTEIADADKKDWCSGRMDTLSKKIYLLFRDRKLQDSDLYLTTTPFSLETTLTYTISSPIEGIRLLDGLIEIKDRRSLFLAGSFHYTNEKQQTSIHDRSTQSSGLFFLSWENDKIEKFQYKNYIDFHQFDSLIGPRNLRLWQEAQRKSKGKTIILPFVSILKVRKENENYYLMAESYQREETTITDSYYDAYGRMVPYTRVVFDGFSFQEAFVWELDTLLNSVDNWIYDASLSRKRKNLSSIVDFFSDSLGNICFAHSDMGKLMYRSFEKDLGYSPAQSFLTETLIPGDKVEYEWEEKFMNWFSCYGLSYGCQRIVNSQKRGAKSKKNVFYLSRITVYNGNDR